jgi:predicted  nucleic acid-binding Zn-ribbon protein
MAEKIPGWLERVLLPQISELKGDVKVVNVRINGLDAKISNLDEKLSGRIDALDEKLSGRIDALDEKLSGRIDALDEKIDGVEKRLESKIDAVDKRMDVTQRLAVVETQLKELAART